MCEKKVRKAFFGVAGAILLMGATTACAQAQMKSEGLEQSAEAQPVVVQSAEAQSAEVQKATQEFPAPHVGTFYAVNPDGADVVEAADGTLFGFPEWLSDGCSSWCGCEEFSCVATATSQLADQGSVSYSPDHVVYHSGDNSDMLDTVWAEGVSGTGIGEAIELRQMYRGNGEDTFTFTEMCIVNGYARNETKWAENGRVKAFRVYYNDEYLGDMTLLDTRQPQYIDLTPFQLQVANGGEAVFRFEIAQVYEGNKYEDTCITGIVIDFAGRIGH